ncbi:PadR family transcriptional regulator [Terrabacter terrigena]|uniref:PadR family transcriptional regulator n=1 Tax=Terrabacter terrigena TaxID=574718 RepID=A0ABW3N388_9MICO
MRRTSTTTNALLGLLGLRHTWSSSELTAQIARNMRFFWPRAESRIYAALTVLASEGMVTSSPEPIGPRRNRTRYAITPAGRRRLKAWLASPPRPTVLECEPLLRLLFGHLGTDDQAALAVRRIRNDGERIQAAGRAIGMEFMERRAPFQEHVQMRALVFDFLASWSSMLIDWADRSQATMARWPEQSSQERHEAALAVIAARLPDSGA